MFPEPINVTKLYLPDKKKFKAYLDKIYASRWIANHGALVKELESRLRDYLGVKNILLVANGTLALQIAYKVFGLTGDVVTTPFSFVATTSSLVWEGLNPIFADIDPKTLCIDPRAVEKAMTKHTSAIVPVHVFGNSCDVEAIQRIAGKHKVKVIYDAAHAFGIKYKGKSILEWGDVSILSFHATKIFHTGEGGALIIKDKALFKQAEQMIDFGITKPDVIEGLGINAKMNELEAAMGLSVLDDVDKIRKNYKALYEHYIDNLSEHVMFPERNKHGDNNYKYFPVLFQSETELLKVKKQLNAANIFPRRYFYPSLNTVSYLSKKQRMPVSEDIAGRILCLPLYDSLQRKSIDKIIAIINQTLG